MPMSAEEPTKNSMLVTTSWLRTRATKWICLCCSRGILFSVIHLLQECLGLLFIHERQASHAIFGLESMEEGSILIVGESVIYFLIPNHPTVRWLVHC
jgi:hypothetical protein